MKLLSLLLMLILPACVQAMARAPELPTSPPPPVSGWDGVPVELAQQCVTLQSETSGYFLTRRATTTAADLNADYYFDGPSLAKAARLFVKPASLEAVHLQDRDGFLLAGVAGGWVRAQREPGKATLWRFTRQANASFELLHPQTDLTLSHAARDGRVSLSGQLSRWLSGASTGVRIVPAQGCTPFAEVSLNVQGDPALLKGDSEQPVRGFIDAHAHITSYEFMGGKMMAGAPFHPDGVMVALKDSAHLHGKDGALDLIGNIYTFNDINMRYDTRGWPEFPWWPNHAQMTHTGYYWRWLERAQRAGLRLIVTNLVENEVLCAAQKNINPASWINPNSCNVMDSVALQAQRLRELEQYIDAQAGGAGKGFFRIVTSPAQARTVIAAGQMAVVMGIEASELFNCGLNDQCDQASIERGLEFVWDLGVRSFYPTHKFDNQLSGSAVEDGFINLGQWLSSGRFFETEHCDATTEGRSMQSGFPLIGQIEGVRQVLDAVHLNPEYADHDQHCNRHGLSELGVYLLNRMIDRRFLIELDHMSQRAATRALDIAEARHYSGVITSHSWMRNGPQGSVHANTRRLLELGGFAAPYNANVDSIDERIERYAAIVRETPYWLGIGIGTDMSGLGGQPGPRRSAEQTPLLYPFESEFGFTFARQLSGERTFDLNTDGIAHYGLLADWLEDVRQQAQPTTYETIMQSAEAYLQMWERAWQRPPSASVW